MYLVVMQTKEANEAVTMSIQSVLLATTTTTSTVLGLDSPNPGDGGVVVTAGE